MNKNKIVVLSLNARRVITLTDRWMSKYASADGNSLLM